MLPNSLRPVVGLVVAASLAAGAVTGATVRQLSLDECLQQAVEKNLGLRLARFDPRLARLALHAAYAPYDPVFTSSVGQAFQVDPRNPYRATPVGTSEIWHDQYSLGLAGFTPTGLSYSLDAGLSRTNLGTYFSPAGQPFSSVNSSGYNDIAGISLRQPLLKDFWIDGARLNITLAKNSIKQSEEVFRAKLFDLCLRVARNYYDLMAAEEGIAVQAAALDLAERSLVENRKQVEIGSLAPLEEKQAEAQVASRRTDLISAQERSDRARNALAGLITDDLASSEDQVFQSSGRMDLIPESLSRQDSWHKALTLRPDICQQKLVLDSWHISLKYDKNQLFPQLDLKGTYGVAGSELHLQPVLGSLADQTNPRFSYGIELKFPLSNRAARDRQKRDRLQLELELVQYKRLEQNAMREVNDFIIAANSAMSRVTTTKEARTYAEVALTAEQGKLTFGRSSSFNVLQLQRDLVAAQSASIQARLDYNQALLDLARAEGSLLDRLKVYVSVE